MNTNQVVRLFAGTVILISLALGAPASPLFASNWWLALTAFVGFNLAQSSLTGFCPLEKILVRLGIRPGC